MKRGVLIVCTLALLLPACGDDPPSQAAATATPDYTPFATAEPPETVLVHFDDATIMAEVAADLEDRARGLMRRRELGADAGMLFLFPQPDRSGFWMKNTLIPLQIAYMRRADEDTFEVLVVMDMEPCKADPCHVYEPGVAYDATLEVNETWFDRHGVGGGSTAEVEGVLPTPL